jgi:hypothetical protein
MNERRHVGIWSTALLPKMLFLAAILSNGDLSADRMGEARQGAETGCVSSLGPEVAGCRLELSVKKKEYLADEPIALFITLHNTSTNEAIVSWRTDYGNYRFTIIDSTGNTVPLSPSGVNRKFRAQCSIFGTTLPPGDQFKNGIYLNAHYEMTNTGSYTVTVSQEVRPKGGTGQRAWVPSAPLAITISPPGTNDTAVATPPPTR